MAVRRLRMCAEDVQRYGGPEVIEWDAERVLDLKVAAAAELEAEMGIALVDVLADDRSALGRKARVWIARRFAGFRDPWAEFDIHPFKVTAEGSEDDETDGDDPDPLSPSPDDSGTSPT